MRGTSGGSQYRNTARKSCQIPQYRIEKLQNTANSRKVKNRAVYTVVLLCCEMDASSQTTYMRPVGLCLPWDRCCKFQMNFCFLKSIRTQDTTCTV